MNRLPLAAVLFGFAVDVFGVYGLGGDALKVACVVGRWKGKEWVGKARPKGFDPKQVDVVIELKRAK